MNEMSTRGSIIARMVRDELKQIDDNLHHLLASDDEAMEMSSSAFGSNAGGYSEGERSDGVQGQRDFSNDLFDDLDLQYELSAEQLISIADSLDMGSLEWVGSNENL